MAFIPVSDVEDRPLVTPIVTVALIVVNVLVYLFVQPHPDMALGSDVPAQLASFYNSYAVIPSRVAEGQNLLSVLTAMFLHADLIHLGSNMLYLWIYGDNVEHALGHLRFLGFYVAAGVSATVVQVLLFSGSDVWNLGASGAIAGVLGAYLAFFPKSQINVLLLRFGIVRMNAAIVIGLWFAIQLLSGGGQLLEQGGGGVAYWAHIGGFVAGVGLALAARAIGMAARVDEL